MNLDAYLQRIHVEKPVPMDLEALRHLQMQHMLHVPFENLDVIHGTPIPLDTAVYFDKIVQKERGGFCYELNGLFHWMLKELGFNNHLISGTVRTPDGSWAIPESHAAQIIQLDQPYLVDVGFGDSARNPLPLSGEVQHDVSGSYRVSHVEGDTFDLQKATDGAWQTLYRFDTKAKELTDFEVACHYNQTSPDSHFTQKEIVTLATPDGRITLSGNELIVTYQGEKHKEHIDPEATNTVLNNYFGIRL